MALAIKDARIEFKATKEVKSLLSDASALLGLDMSAFIISTAELRARQVIQEYQSLSLSKGAQAKLMEVLLNPPKPSEDLKALMKMDDFIEH